MAQGSGVDPLYEEQLRAHVWAEVCAIVGIGPDDEQLIDDDEIASLIQAARELAEQFVAQIVRSNAQKEVYYGKNQSQR